MRPGALPLLACVALPAAGCDDQLPPAGEVLIIVDTDLPVPTAASRLRIDVYAEDGTWYESGTVGLHAASDWPASFGVVSPDNVERRVLVRLRLFPEGKERDYLGERFVGRGPYTPPPKAPGAMNELCAAPAPLPMGGTVTLRRGRDPFLGELLGGDCGDYATLVGSTAAVVEVDAPGAYRFGVLAVEPSFYQVTLQVRRACADASTALGCNSNAEGEAPYLPPHVDLDLDEGTYHVMTAGAVGPDAPADIVLGAAPVAEWPPSRPATEPVPAEPQLIGAGKVTPITEPQPFVTVDRLLLVRIVPDKLLSTRVTLRGACLGTMAQLSSQWPHQQVSVDQASTCVATEGEREPPFEAPLEDGTDRGPSLQGTFVAPAPCPPAAPGAEVVCVPGGFFMLGSVETRDGEDTDSVPEHPALMPPFSIDRHEVTVRRYREALALKFNPGRDKPLANEGPMDDTVVGDKPEVPQNDDLCTWSKSDQGREEWPVNCISWYGARAFCQFYGGDLPTEAQWEYVATAAARPFETSWPWGDGEPTCERAVIGRSDETLEKEAGACHDGTAQTVGPRPVTERDGPAGDETPPIDGINGVAGLAGNVREWVRDAFRPFDHPCWQAASVVDPKCMEDDAPLHGTRGGSWFVDGREAWVTARQPSGAQAHPMQVGFRCVYPWADPQ